MSDEGSNFHPVSPPARAPHGVPPEGAVPVDAPRLAAGRKAGQPRGVVPDEYQAPGKPNSGIGMVFLMLLVLGVRELVAVATSRGSLVFGVLATVAGVFGAGLWVWVWLAYRRAWRFEGRAWSRPGGKWWR